MGFLASTTTQDMLNILASKGQINKGGYKMYIRERGQGTGAYQRVRRRLLLIMDPQTDCYRRRKSRWLSS